MSLSLIEFLRRPLALSVECESFWSSTNTFKNFPQAVKPFDGFAQLVQQVVDRQEWPQNFPEDALLPAPLLHLEIESEKAASCHFHAVCATRQNQVAKLLHWNVKWVVEPLTQPLAPYVAARNVDYG